MMTYPIKQGEVHSGGRHGGALRRAFTDRTARAAGSATPAAPQRGRAPLGPARLWGEMGKSYCLERGLRGWLKFANLVEGLAGLAIAGYGAYLMVKMASTFSDVVLGNGLFMLVAAVVGFSSAGRDTGGCLRIYSVLLALMFVAHVALSVTLFAKRDKVLRWIKDSGADAERERFIKRHIETMAWVVLGTSCLELVCLAIACGAPNRVVRTDGEEYQRWRGGSGYEPLAERGGDTLSRKQRDRMNAKYGNQFAKRYDSSDDVAL